MLVQKDIDVVIVDVFICDYQDVIIVVVRVGKYIFMEKVIVLMFKEVNVILVEVCEQGVKMIVFLF